MDNGAPPPPDVPLDLMRRFYRTMLRIRAVEERIAELVETKEVRCPCHLYIGQEAIATGVCEALATTDYVWGGHRSHGHYLAKGGDLKSMMAEIFGKETGCSSGRGGSMHLCAPEVGILGTVPLVAATVPLAVGAALAAKLRGDGRVSVSFFGDGAVEEGHCHESMNVAALYQLPILFVCENNLYASHLGLLERRREDNLPQAGKAHGMESLRLDGNDVLGIYAAARRLVDLARRESRPAFLECRTYRWRGHVGPSWDMDVGVLRKDELKDWMPKDPIARLRRTLEALGSSPPSFERLNEEISREVDDAVRYARESAYPSPEGVVHHVYARRPEKGR